MVVIRDGYVCVLDHAHRTKTGKKAYVRNWWEIQKREGRYGGQIVMGTLHVPVMYVGKKLRFKVEVVEE